MKVNPEQRLTKIGCVCYVTAFILPWIKFRNMWDTVDKMEQSMLYDLLFTDFKSESIFKKW